MNAPNIKTAPAALTSARKLTKRLAFGDVPGLAPLAFLFLAFLYLPIFVLVAFSFNDSNIVMVWTGFSTDWYAKVFANVDTGQEAFMDESLRNAPEIILPQDAKIVFSFTCTPKAQGLIDRVWTNVMR